MKREEVQVVRYESVDGDFDSIIDFHKLISKGTNLEGHLIYFDENFILFFKNIIKNKESNFVSVLKINNVVSGFIHFKLFENTVFLNNICLKQSCQGEGIGKYFLKESLNLVYDGSQEKFELDVFLSNQKALKWYIKLGLEIQRKSNWIKIVKGSHKLKTENLSQTYFLQDNNGFDSIFFRNAKIATIVNKRTIIIHDVTFLEKISIEKYDTVITSQDVSKFKFDDYEFILLETSARMNGRIKDVFDKN